MRFELLKKWFAQSENYNLIEKYVAEENLPLVVNEISENAASAIIYSLNKSGFIVVGDQLAGRRMYEDLSLFLGDKVVLMPERELMFYDVESYSRDIISKRMDILYRLYKKEDIFVVTTGDNLLYPTLPKEVFDMCVTFNVGKTYNLDEILQLLNTFGYSREEMVEGMGQYAVRGGILDFYPYNADNPYRVEFFDDEVDGIREFDFYTQRSLETVESATITPACETMVSADEMLLLAEKISKIKGSKKDIERLENGVLFPSIDKYIPLIKHSYIYEYDKSLMLYMIEPTRVKEGIENGEDRVLEQVAGLTEAGVLPANMSCDYRGDYYPVTYKRNVISFCSLTPKTDFKPRQIVKFSSRMQTTFHGKIEFLYDGVKSYKKDGYKVLILAGTETKGKNLTKALNDEGITAVYQDELSETESVIVTHGVMSGGFSITNEKIAIICDKEIFGMDRKPKRRIVNKSGDKIGSFTDLEVFDYVVHQNHGIGQFVGVKSMEVDGATGDYIHIQFKGTDSLYLPANQLDLLYKYTGKDGAKVKLNKLSGGEWNKVKQRVSVGCKEMADQLIALYSKRQHLEGFKFSKDTPWQREFEDNFQFEETDDQLRCIQEMKDDMESTRPMDRLLCGDVGYGKTEVAIRGAFKAVMDGKQVAYLVPTTILASQHYHNFCNRMKDYPIEIGMLSRFKSKKEQKEIIKLAKQGAVDIIIGTHRIIQKDLEFKNLGLLIIDEEQRFGVAAKEKIKELRANVDVITLSATPIPRTLHMSLVGIRDMSVIENPPKDRYPVSTYVLEYDINVLKEAILREVGRGGQVYYLHNRVDNIDDVAIQITKFAPGLRVATGHGKMSERQLEDIMNMVENKEIDVLVCTTIIETGLDIANVNTIIIEDADKMGLSQLYQLRGRVGRSDRLAYAYLCYKKDKVLNEVAEKRLRAIREFTEFGSGFKIALRDLEIRGAGNLVGAEQHGHMDAVGYDLYCQLLGEAVSQAKGETKKPAFSAQIKLKVDAYIPKEYVTGETARMEIYKKIATIETEEDSFDVYDEIADRYGTLPKKVDNLIAIGLISAYAKPAGIEEISQYEKSIVYYFKDDVDFEVITQLVGEFKGKMMFSPSDRAYLTYIIKGKEDILGNIKIILQRYNYLKNL